MEIRHLYIGSYETVGGNVTAKIKCTNDRNTLVSIFGNLKEFNLVLKGSSAYDIFTLHGHMLENPQMEITVKLTRRAELP